MSGMSILVASMRFGPAFNVREADIGEFFAVGACFDPG